MSTSAPTTTSASETQPDERADSCNSCASWDTPSSFRTEQ